MIAFIKNLFTSKPKDAQWTVSLDDVKYNGVQDDMHVYTVVWHKGPAKQTSTYHFPTQKTPERVLKLARHDAN